MDCVKMSEEYILRTERVLFNTDLPLYVERTSTHSSIATDSLYTRLVKAYGQGASIEVDGTLDVLENIFKHRAFCVLPIPVVEKARFNVNDLMQIMDILISENGCPWDRVQTHESISNNLLEEAQEAVDAIANKDVSNMQEEFGDVLLQSVFQSRIAEKNQTFNFDDVVTTLCQKLIRRHTHVFGGESASNSEEALNAWQIAKAKEKERN